MVGNASGVDLNNASAHELARIGGIRLVLAARIVEHRPFREWIELETIEGLDHEMVNDLRGSGAQLGQPKASKAEKLYSRVLRQSSEWKDSSPRGRPSKNIFCGEGSVLDSRSRT
jgi:hypothetical protein